MSDIESIIVDAFEHRAEITPRNVSTVVRDATMEAIEQLLGSCRVDHLPPCAVVAKVMVAGEGLVVIVVIENTGCVERRLETLGKLRSIALGF